MFHLKLVSNISATCHARLATADQQKYFSNTAIMRISQLAGDLHNIKLKIKFFEHHH